MKVLTYKLGEWDNDKDMEGAVYEFVADAKQKFPGY